MGTSSAIGIKQSNGQIQAITCHWDGYPEHVGRILHEFYSHEAKAKRLLRLGRHSKPSDYLPATREFLAAVGEAHSAFNSTLILKANGVNARFVDLSGWMSTDVFTLDEAILKKL